MRLNIFTKSLIEIVTTSLVALALFTLLIASSAQAQENDVKPIHLQTTSSETLLSKKIALVLHLERYVEQSEKSLQSLEAEFEDGKASAEALFVATLQVNEIKNALEESKVNLLVELNSMAQHHNKMQVLANTK